MLKCPRRLGPSGEVVDILIDTRGHQLFPVLDAAQIATAKRFASGAARKFAPGETVYDVGTRNTPTWLVLKGTIDISRRDGLNHETAIATLGIGQITGEVGQLAGRTSLALGRAVEAAATALPFNSANLRALLIGSADVGERLCERSSCGESDSRTAAGSVLIGQPGAPDVVRLQGFLARNGYPHTVLDAETADGQEWPPGGPRVPPTCRSCSARVERCSSGRQRSKLGAASA